VFESDQPSESGNYSGHLFLAVTFLVSGHIRLASKGHFLTGECHHGHEIVLVGVLLQNRTQVLNEPRTIIGVTPCKVSYEKDQVGKEFKNISNISRIHLYTWICTVKDEKIRLIGKEKIIGLGHRSHRIMH